MKRDERRIHGVHYTTEPLVLRVLRPLFLEDLEARLQIASTPDALHTFLEYLGSLTFLDPACGTGNFLVVAYRAVRALEDGREISGIEYEAHSEMAQHQMETIAREAQAEFALEQVILQHRIGFVAAGEASLFLRVTSAHRRAAYEGSAWIVAELKQKVPIWKRPVFAGQESAVKAE